MAERLPLHVQAHPDRQSRRDRLPDHQDRAPDGHRDGRGLFRRRPRRAACRDGGRGGADRPAAGGRELSRRSRRSSRPARQTGAEAVHPGYGFLSEREAFPQALAKAGIVFIGPNPEGDRRHGRQDRVQEGRGQGQGLDRARPSRRDRRREAGGEDRRRDRLSGDDQGLGRRRRQGHAHRAFAEPRWRRASRARARRRKSSFGDDRVFIEKFIVDPRHIEIQVLGDKHGNVIYLGERECSIQRRNQKVVEEAPSPLLDDGDAQEDGRAGGRAGQGRRLRQRRHGRVRRRAGQELLFPRDEHAAAGRASGDRARHRHRSGRADDPRRGRREARAQAERREAQRLGGREPRLCRGPVPQLPAVDRPADALPAAGREPATTASRCATTPASTRAARSRSTTIR